MNRTQITNQIEVLQFPRLGWGCNIFHFVTTRRGGVGRASYATLNLGEYCGDEENVWKENRRLFCKALQLPLERLFVPFQTHQANILDITRSFLSLSPEQQKEKMQGIDALVTTLQDVCIAVTTADCVPLLIYAPDKQVVAAIHAGWRGTIAGIAGKVVNYLMDQYRCDPLQLQVGIAPAISRKVFEVGDEVIEAFRDIILLFPEVCWENSKTGKRHLDLSLINKKLLAQQGVPEDNIELSGLCTFRNKDDFFSARREGIASGRMLTGLVIKKETL